MGDPAGIGPEIAIKVVTDPRVTAVCEPVLYGPHTAAERERFTPGVLSAEAGRVAYEAVEQAVADAMAGRLDAITTGPINKAALALAGFAWRGHTELLAHLTGARDVAMMFHSPRLRVVLATVHVPLSAVPRLLTQARVETTLTLAASALPRFGVATPRLALAGLNPHAGEGGLLVGCILPVCALLAPGGMGCLDASGTPISVRVLTRQEPDPVQPNRAPR